MQRIDLRALTALIAATPRRVRLRLLDRPDSNPAIVSGSSELPAVGCQVNGTDLVIPSEGIQQFARFRISSLNGLITSDCIEDSAVGGKNRTFETTRVGRSVCLPKKISGFCIPVPERSVPT